MVNKNIQTSLVIGEKACSLKKKEQKLKLLGKVFLSKKKHVSIEETKRLFETSACREKVRCLNEITYS